MGIEQERGDLLPADPRFMIFRKPNRVLTAVDEYLVRVAGISRGGQSQVEGFLGDECPANKIRSFLAETCI